MPQFTLMQHQTEGVKFIEDHDGIAALLYDPGVGKTGTTLSWIDSQAHKRASGGKVGEFRVLVVAPLAAANTWVFQAPSFMDSLVKARMLQGSTLSILSQMSQARDWAAVPKAEIGANHKGPRLNQRVTIISISAGSISRFCDERTKTIQVLRAVRKYAPDLIVVDESHIIKSATSNISAAVYQMGQLAPHRIILTGTVNPLSILDCYGQWRFLAPWTFSDSNDEPFVKDPLNMTRKQAASIRPWPWKRFQTRYSLAGGYKGKGIGGFQNEDDLRTRIGERSHVVRKEDALDLPPFRDVDVHVQLSAKESHAYQEMAEELLLQLETGELLEAPNALAKMMKLRQIASGIIKDTETGEVHHLGDSMREVAKDLVQTTLAGEHRVVVFGYFRYECELLTKMMAEKNTQVLTVTGSVKAKDRLAIRRAFADVSGNLSAENKKRTILVAQQRTMSLSVNELVVASNAVFTSQSEQRVDYVQSRDRLHRKGQTLPVTFWNCFTPGLIGEIMINRHKDRGSLEKALLDHIRTFAR